MTLRSLKFNVTAQKIEKSPNCDFTGLIRGTKGYLYADFSFSNEYFGCEKIAVFTKFEEEYPVKLENDSCMIPEEALTWRAFGIYVIGLKPGYRIRTERITVEQNG